MNGTRHALLVQPNSGYGGDNRCMLDAIRTRPDLFKGVDGLRTKRGRVHVDSFYAYSGCDWGHQVINHDTANSSGNTARGSHDGRGRAGRNDHTSHKHHTDHTRTTH